jgi:sialic acid synthase SpsE
MTEGFSVGGRKIGPGEPTYVIAEAGSNHNQNLEQARQLIDVAARAGADAIKFQLFTADVLYPTPGEIHDAIRAAETPREWVPGLTEYAETKGLTFLASPFDEDAVEVLAASGAPAYKCASSETTNLPLVREMASRGKPVFVSTGMCDMADVFEAVQVIRGQDNEDIALLQCSSLYPTPTNRVHLRVMETLSGLFNRPVGFSDHTMNTYLPAVAVGLGANVIEKHFTLDRTLPGPDHSYALEPDELKDMVTAIRGTEEALGSSEKVMLEEEAEFARRETLHAARDIESGATITADDMAIDRPANGLRPRYMGAVEGRAAKGRIASGDPIRWDSV